MAALTDADKSRIRYHLGYPGTTNAASIVAGIPKTTTMSFLLENAMNLCVEDGAVARVQSFLTILDNIELQLTSMSISVMAKSVGGIQLHPRSEKGILGTDSLEGEYIRWASRVADILGVPMYPYSARFSSQTGAPRVVPVRRG